MFTRSTFMPQPFRSFLFLLRGCGDAFFYSFEPAQVVIGYLLFVIWLLVVGCWELVWI